ncbi:MAG: NAD(P)H-hydrate dehydratase [Acidobacteria bacterium]|nr:MAG: NAD(P)H-hydrate dehydratase [Acidobacteriota bacterium]REK02246.1 MAG: NAD(P)H-hydrate dehydratase [Acidobacteriota bacterium]REK13951.1 MAG: NAD(P)H-hydrate dehydratase [Acidobacteriota bacterium]REK41945.1 MAG: NAD(P)H-hydrate dehydratase [Acidobacteriota bacterium]
MRPLLTASEMEEADRLTTEQFGIPSILLMENAAMAIADAAAMVLSDAVKGEKIVVVCGKGNNGGDGAAAARLLWLKGARVRIFLLGNVEETKGDARTNFEAARALHGRLSPRGGTIEFAEIPDIGTWKDALSAEIQDSAVAIDALFGTGLARPLEGDAALAAEFLQTKGPHSEPQIISVDIPSGLAADSSEVYGPCVTADLTVTFTAPKLANVMPPAGSRNGDLEIADIGTPAELAEAVGSGTYISELSDAGEWLRKTAFTDISYKKKRGTVALVAGSSKYAGAAVLAANGAIESGVGMVTLAVPKSALAAVTKRLRPEVITVGISETSHGFASAGAFDDVADLLSSCDAVGIGCGLGSEEQTTRELVCRVIENRKCPVVIDADGLNSIAPMSFKGTSDAPLILTPHQGEFLRLLGTENKSAVENRISAVRKFSRDHSVITVLKGPRSLVAEPGGKVVLVTSGNAGTGKAGNGDNLAGILTGFVAQARRFSIDQFETSCAAVHIAGIAADLAMDRIGTRSMLATDVRRYFAEAVRAIEEAV